MYIGLLPRLSACLVAIGILSTTLDVPLAIWLENNRLPGELVRPFKFAEIGGHGTGAAMVLLATVWLARQHWPRSGQVRFLLRLVGATYMGGLLVDGLKLMVPRVRPRYAELTADVGALETFGHGLLAFGEHSRAALMSFPSGHGAVATGLATALCWFYPPGRPVYICLATLACLQRLLSGSHYLSDVFIGAGLGILGAWLTLRIFAKTRRSDLTESQWSNDDS